MRTGYCACPQEVVFERIATCGVCPISVERLNISTLTLCRIVRDLFRRGADVTRSFVPWTETGQSAKRMIDLAWSTLAVSVHPFTRPPVLTLGLLHAPPLTFPSGELPRSETTTRPAAEAVNIDSVAIARGGGIFSPHPCEGDRRRGCIGKPG